MYFQRPIIFIFIPKMKDVRAYKCPLCGVQLPVQRDMDPNALVEQHIASGCQAPKVCERVLPATG